VHGAVRDLHARAAQVVDDELASVTGNPILMGTLDHPRAVSGAHAVGAALGLAADSLGIAVAELAAMAERRVDRLVNPLLSNLPAFLAADDGAHSGFMIAQYTGGPLVADNRRLAPRRVWMAKSPRACREDHLSHATPGALAAQDHRQRRDRPAIELLAAPRAYELQRDADGRAAQTDAGLPQDTRRHSHYRDDCPRGSTSETVREMLARPPESGI
jgi:histidine ammonia-lyase